MKRVPVYLGVDEMKLILSWYNLIPRQVRIKADDSLYERFTEEIERNEEVFEENEQDYEQSLKDAEK